MLHYYKKSNKIYVYDGFDNVSTPYKVITINNDSTLTFTGGNGEEVTLRIKN